ncbi:MAG: alpha/beta hydrolase [Planctomycetota bacterium]|nr:alpha/beta hydrolase [Planctomycetota bacterium]
MSESAEQVTPKPEKTEPIKTTLAGRIRRLLSSLLCIYVLLALFAWFGAELLIFQPHPSGYKDHSAITKLTCADGTKISAFYLPNPKAKYTILYSHGNAEDLADVRSTLMLYQRLGYAVLSYDYPGYGTSEGRPTESGCYQAIDAAYAHLTKDLKVPSDQIILMGRSVGGGPTMYLASTKEHKALILESTFTSTFRVAIPFPLFPFDRFPNKQRISQYKKPLLLMHGSADRVIPYWHGEANLEACPSEIKQALLIDGAGHNNFRQKAGQRYIEVIKNFPKAF